MSGTSSNAKYSKKANGNGDKEQREWKGFVELRLTAIDVEALRSAEFDADSVTHFLETVAREGYRVSVSYDPGKATWTAVLTGTAGSGPNEGRSLSGKAGEMCKALLCLAYKHVSIAGRGDWSAVASDSGAARFE